MTNFPNQNEDFFGPPEETARCNRVVEGVSTIVQAGVSGINHMGGKIALLCGCAIPPLSILAAAFGKTREEDTCYATTDSTIFGAIYLVCSIEQKGKGIICGFSPENVTKAQTMFKMIMGRDYDDIHPQLQDLIAERAAEAADVPTHLKRFMPN